MSVTSTSLTELKAATAPVIKPGDDAKELGFFSGSSFNLTYRVAQVFAQSTLVPKHYQGNISNCMIALNMAHRLGADPLMVCQNLYIVNGAPAWSAQFLIATFNMCGRFSAIRYKWTGKEGTDERGCQAWAVETATGHELDGTVITIGLAKREGWQNKPGSKWQTMPEQMLRYRAAAWFVRTYAPEIAMGLHTAEEMYDMRQTDNGVYEFDNAPIRITTDEIKEEAAVEQAAPEPTEKPQSSTPEPEPVKPKPGKEAAGSAQEGPSITRPILEAIEKELTRLGAPGHLPPDIVDEYGTGDPSELTEAQGKQTLTYLRNMK